LICDMIFKKKGPCPWLSSEALSGQGQRVLCTGMLPRAREAGRGSREPQGMR